MPHYYLKLNPPRPTFALDMSADETALMKEHAGYWMSHMQRGGIHVFGPVMDPKGPFGLGIGEFANDGAARAFLDGDPAIKAQRGFSYEIHPMQAVIRQSIAA